MDKLVDVREVLPPARDKADYVNCMFARIAHRYDLMNRLMTGGVDRKWRRAVVEYADAPPGGRVLDVGTGTGDIAHDFRARHAGVLAIGIDFTYEMMVVGRRKATHAAIPYVQGDALILPFDDSTFDAVVSGFLLRNVVDRMAALREQARVTKPGGRVVCLETTPSHDMVWGPLFRFYFFHIVPVLGGLISGDRAAYRYLPHSTVDFPEPRELARMMVRAGLSNVFYRELMSGAVAIHVGHRMQRPGMRMSSYDET